MKSLKVMTDIVSPPPDRDSAGWASTERIMPPSAPIPGPFDAKRNPYIVPISQAAANFKYNRITAVMGTQMGKSVGFENIVGWRMDDDPVPVLYIAPTSSMIDSTIEPKIMDMLEQCSSLKRKFDVKRSTKYVKWIGGVKFRFAWAGSPSEMAADSAGLILVDEVDRIVNTSEGDSTEIIEARGDAYVDSKVVYTATPTGGKVEKSKHEKSGLEHWSIADKEKLFSKIWQLWQQGTRHEWAVPCPDCGDYFIPHSGLLWWPGKDGDEEVSPTVAEKEARLICPCCGVQIKDKYRQQMNKRGVPVAPGESITKSGEIVGVADTEGNSHFSFAVSGMFSFSAKKSLGYCAKRLVNAINSGDPESLQGVYNTVFGECYLLTGEVPEWESVKLQSWKYHSQELIGNPEKILCTVDVQKNRLVYVVRAWFKGLGSALIEHGELWGNTLDEAVWDELADMYDNSYDGFEIDEIGVDCGYRDDKVFAFVNAHKGRARALRGDKLDKPYRCIKLDVNNKGKVRKKGSQRWEFDSSRAKAWVHTRIGWAHNKRSFWLLPADISTDYCKQIVGEEFIPSSGTWKKVGENHFLDCEAMQYMLARMNGLKSLKGALLKDVLKQSFESYIETPKEPEKPSEKASKPQAKKKESNSQPQQPADDWLGTGDSWL